MAYTEITRRLFGEKLRAIEEEKQPSYVLGSPTKQMLALHARHQEALRVAKLTEAQLSRLGARSETTGLGLHYERERKLRNAWYKRQNDRREATRSLRAKAQIALLDMPAKAAKAYLQKLEHQLAKI